jgi:hypothetical protein
MHSLNFFTSMFKLCYLIVPIILLKKVLLSKVSSSVNPNLTTTKSLDGIIKTRCP